MCKPTKLCSTVFDNVTVRSIYSRARLVFLFIHLVIILEKFQDIKENNLRIYQDKNNKNSLTAVKLSTEQDSLLVCCLDLDFKSV